MPVPKVVSQEEVTGDASEAVPLTEKKRKGRKKIRDWTRDVRGLQGDGREAGEGLEIAVGSGFEVLDYAEDIRELGEALKRDLQIFEGHLMEVFEVKFRICPGKMGHAMLLRPSVSEAGLNLRCNSVYSVCAGECDKNEYIANRKSRCLKVLVLDGEGQ